MPDWKHYLDLIDKNITNFKNCTRIIKDDELDVVEVHEVIKNAEKEYVEAFKNFELSSIRNSSDENLSHLKELYFRKLDNLKNSYIQLKNDYKHQKMSSGGTLPLHADRSRETNLAHRKNENLLKLIQKLHEQINLSESTTSELYKSSNLVMSTRDQVSSIDGLTNYSAKVTRSYQNKKLVDLFIILLLLVIFLLVVVFMVIKRLR